jgi:transcriptional regulator with XRE-family HTH domain
MIKNEGQRQRIGARIAQLRREQQLTQRELGERCGLADTHIARIEKGRYSVGFDTLQAIAEGLNKIVDIV